MTSMSDEGKDVTLPEIEPDREFPNREQQRRQRRAYPNITPGHLRIGESLKHECEEAGNDRE